MSVTDEGGGRLNAFAKEPEIEVIRGKSSDSNGSRFFVVAGIVFISLLIAYSLTIK
tara:strand:+ start:371 stop:538 length:168 start_codon:yes stop_codon:yes gene_type:complete